MKTDTTSRSLLRIPAGVITTVSLLGVIGYIVWIVSGRYTPEIYAIVSGAALILLNLLVFAFGLYVALDRRYVRTLRWGWWMLTLGALCLAIVSALRMFSEPVLAQLLSPVNLSPALAGFTYSLYYPLALVGVLILTFVFVPRKERGLLWLDLGIVMTFMFMFLWYSYLTLLPFTTIQSMYEILLVANPLGNFIILAALIALIQRDLTIAARQILIFIALSMLFAILADILFAYIEIWNADPRVNPNVMWMFACLAGMLAAARLIASGPGLVNDPPARFSYVGSMLRLALPYLAVIIGMALLVIAIHTDPVARRPPVRTAVRRCGPGAAGLAAPIPGDAGQRAHGAEHAPHRLDGQPDRGLQPALLQRDSAARDGARCPLQAQALAPAAGH